MVKKLISKFEFSKRCGVSAAAVTKACKNSLAPAMVGKRIDAAHTKAVEYAEKHDPAKAIQPATGIDPEYETVVAWCLENGIYSQRGVVRSGIVGKVKAKRILATMAANGITAPPAQAAIIAGPAKVTVLKAAPSGHIAVREKKKQSGSPMVLEIPDDIREFLDMTLRDLVDKFGTDVRLLDWLKATKEIENINEKRLKNAKTQGELVSRELVKHGIISPIESAHIKLLTDGSKTIARRSSAMATAGRPLEDIEKFVIDQISSFIRPVKAKVRRAIKNA